MCLPVCQILSKTGIDLLVSIFILFLRKIWMAAFCRGAGNLPVLDIVVRKLSA